MDIEKLLKKAVLEHASDLHIASTLTPRLRIDGVLEEIKGASALSARDTFSLIEGCMDAVAKKKLEENWDVDFALDLKNVGRFRVNIFRETKGVAAAFRVIPEETPTLEDLIMPPIIGELTNLPHGLVLVTGPTGSGKSTTLAAMINKINHEKSAHIITIEDPIEFLYTSDKSLINQRELDKSTKSFAHALRSALREDPDIILVGEMRDLETVRLALTAAETGHLVFATLHTPSAPESIHRIIDVFPGEEKALVRSMLSESLQAIVAQNLVPKKGGGRVAVLEVMIANTAIRNLIREDKVPQMMSVIQTNSLLGMQTFEQHRKELKKHKIIDE
ncbi:MAG: type IV pilus twitching motility protein PilT [Gammaproteobacteria bacterium]|nr:type IV pilus twitching motility protein PilT [Gammaproteobacteria bacterium]